MENIEEALISQIGLTEGDEAILKEALLNSARGTYEYKLGRMEEREQQYSDDFLKSAEKIQLPAQAFYYFLQKYISKENISQHRVGMDNTTGTPTVLSVVSQNVIERLPELQNMASALVLFMFKAFDCDVGIWVISDHKLDQELINQDFPYLVSAVNV